MSVCVRVCARVCLRAPTPAAIEAIYTGLYRQLQQLLVSMHTNTHAQTHAHTQTYTPFYTVQHEKIWNIQNIYNNMRAMILCRDLHMLYSHICYTVLYRWLQWLLVSVHTVRAVCLYALTSPAIEAIYK